MTCPECNQPCDRINYISQANRERLYACGKEVEADGMCDECWAFLIEWCLAHRVVLR